MKQFTITRMVGDKEFVFEFHVPGKVDNYDRLIVNYRVPSDEKIKHNEFREDGMFNANYDDKGIINFYALTLNGKKVGGLQIIDELRNELDELLRQAVAAKKNVVENEIESIRNGSVLIRPYYYDGEYLSGYTVSGQEADLLAEIGLTRYVDGWGYLVRDEVVEALGKEFTYAAAVEYAQPAIDAAAKKAAEQAEKKAQREIEKATMIVKILRQNPGEEGEDPSADVEITDSETGETARFSCRNIFDFGYVVNPLYSVGHGLKPGGLAKKNENGKWIWQDFESERSWYDVRPLTPFEVKALDYLRKFSPVPTGIRM